jgi:hypothetical protein
MESELTPNEYKFSCNICYFKTNNKKDYNKHIATRKHDKLTNNNLNEDDNKEVDYYCELCSKHYKSRVGLYKHKKNCVPIETQELQLEEHCLHIPVEAIVTTEKPVEDVAKAIGLDNGMMIEFMKQSQDFQKEMFSQIMEFMKAQSATITNNNNINNGQIQNNNTHFNLQVYLNETCKNAMTINQFLDYLQPTLQELEDTARLGYVESISRIIMRGFKNLEEEELPFHCTDLKREHIYVKNPDKEWVKETDEKPLLLRFVKEVARRNFNNIFAWQKQNPQWSNYHSKQNDLYNSIVANAMSGATEKEQNDNYEKIMKNILKNTTIDRSKKNKK